MFEKPGIGVEDLACIHRDQFVHYVELARGLGVPEDWPRFRRDLLRALTAAFGLRGADGAGQQARALEVLDEVRAEHDPGTEWPRFFEALWSRRHHIRPDLPRTPPCPRAKDAAVHRTHEARHITRPSSAIPSGTCVQTRRELR